jgi:hypothetical protein
VNVVGDKAWQIPNPRALRQRTFCQLVRKVSFASVSKIDNGRVDFEDTLNGESICKSAIALEADGDDMLVLVKGPHISTGATASVSPASRAQ